MYTSPTQLLFLFVWFIVTNCEIYNDRPKIKTIDGDLILEPAPDRHIYLKPNGPNSKIFVDVYNILNLNEHSSVRPNDNIDQNKYRVPDDVNELYRRIEALEKSTSAIQNQLNTSISYFSRRINNLRNKVLNLQTSRRKKNECQSNPCENGGTCLNLVDGHYCLCPSNWRGDNCDEDVNECRIYAGTKLGCQNGATCVNKPGSYECLCKPGWYGLDCTSRAKDCSGGDFEMCGHGTCISVTSGEGIKCICNQGWTTNGTSEACLTDINECDSSQGAHCSVNPKVECINLPGSFRCGDCPAGYQGDGFICHDIDECLTIPNGGCSTSPMVSCHNTIGSRMCGSCPPGYQGDGVTCSWRGSCSVNKGGCHPSAICYESPSQPGLALCLCPYGMEGDGIGLYGCYISTDNTTQRCESNPCGAHGHCHPLQHGYSCICHEGYGGAHCEQISNFCSSNPCHNGGTCRVDNRQSKGFRCECTALYSGDLCQVHAQPCGGVLDSEEGSIIYPLSNNYEHNSRCAWVIHTTPDKIINVTFTKFNLEYHTSCLYDFVQIHDGRSSASQLIGRFCGNTFPNGGNIISSHNNLYFWFRSDHSVAKEGFALHWTSIPPFCGGEIDASTHGQISSPGSPGSYPPNRDCFWHLSTTLGKRIQLHFFQLDIELHANCSFDYVAIYDGEHITDPLINKYCNSSLPAPVQSASSEMLIHFHSDEYGSGKGFQISYAPVEGVPGCGGFFTTDKGELVSPSYNGAYLNNLLCEYKIKTGPDTKIRIDFKSFKIESSFKCRYDFLKIYDGPSSDSGLVGKYCGSDYPKSYTSSTNNLFIIFKSDHTMASEGFRLTYESSCIKTIVGDSGIIKTPGWPISYPKHTVCEYVISSRPGKAIRLQFQDFDIEDNRYYNCEYDHVEIRDGHTINSTLLGKYCGGSESTPPVQISTLNYMYIRFVSDMSITGRGFFANFTTIDTECGGIYRDPHSIINHPVNSNEYYTNDQSCIWMLIAPEGMHIKLTWNRFQIEDMPSCNSDYVELIEVGENNENSTLGRYCGYSLPPALTTSTNRLIIKFESDSSIRDPGFSLSYAFLDEKTHCGGLFVKPHGYIYSPGWPKNYESNRDCNWTIIVPVGQQITLNFTVFDLERPIRDNCDLGDYLTIRDGSSENSSKIGTFCGYFKTKRIVSTANSIYLKFHSDFYLGGSGFQIEWDGSVRGCGATLTGAQGSISSPNYPQNYNEMAECFYRIVTSSGSRIQISFIDLDLERTNECTDDYVEIFDGRDNNALSFGRHCYLNSKLNKIVTTSNYAFIKFRSDFYLNGKGFLLNYRTICYNNISGSHGIIESPGYPNPYPFNSNCLWNITVPKGNKINVTFTEFSMSPTFLRPILYSRWSALRHSYLFSCESDYVQFKEMSDSTFSNKKCGNSLPNPISTKSNSLLIKFASGTNFPRKGFRLEWVSYGCGGHIQKRFGSLRLERTLSLAGAMECEWVIETPIGTAVSLTISDLYMAEAKNCTIDAIEFYNGQSIKSPLLTKICHRGITTVQASSNYLLVRLVKKSSLRDVYFNSHYDSFKEGCGGGIDAPSGMIHSKNYPQNYDNNMDCLWLLSVPKNHKIELNFIEFDLYDCGDTVKIYDGADIFNTNYTYLICPTSNVSQIISTHSSVMVQFTTDSYGTAKGFKANFTMACGAIITANYDGIISNNNHISHNNKNCTWTILAPKLSQKIKLTIQHMSLPKNTDIITNRNCPSSYLRVFDGDDDKSPLIEELCGNKIPPMLVSHGNALTVQLGTYSDIIDGHFSAHYTTLMTACGGSLTSEEGTIASPNFPQSYPNNANCEWILKTSPGNRIYITFESFDLDYSEGCNEDYLEVRENNGAGKLLAVYCGNEIPANTTTGTKLYIKFHSDEKETGTGFLIHYGFLHGNEISGLEGGEIASPLYPFPYDRQGVYNWRIIVSGSTFISLNIDHLEIPKHSDICESKLLIYDGYNEEAPILLEICGIENEHKIVQTTSNVAFIKLVLDDTNMGSLFHLKWVQSNKDLETERSTEINCGFNQTKFISAEKRFKFSSPNYPNPYDLDANCMWIFRSLPGRHLTIKFSNIALEETPNCFADYVSIYSSNTAIDWLPVVENVCLAENKNKKLNSESYMKVIFKSDSTISREGFQATVRSECGGQLKGPSGIVEVTWYDQNIFEFTEDTRCNWTVKVRPGKTMKLHFEHFNISNINDCVTYVVLRNGESYESPLLGNGKYCGFAHENRSEMISSGNSIYITYVIKKPLAPKAFQNFRLRYEESNFECGFSSVLDSNHKSEIISSPNYPSVPDPFTECIWTFTGPPGEILRIDFIDRFDLQYSEQCIYESIEIRDGSSQISPIKEVLCKERPGTIKSTSNTMFVKYSTQVPEPRNGFKANVSIDICGGTIIASSGEISSPGYPHLMFLPMGTVCQWHIVSVARHSIQIQFKDFDLPESETPCETSVTIEEHTPTKDTRQGQIKELCYDNFEEEEKSIQTLTNEVLVKLHIGKTKEWIQMSESRGFRFSFNSTIPLCGGVISTSEGFLMTPGYPRETSTRYCQWIITVPNVNRRIRLEILDFESIHNLGVYNDMSFNSKIEETFKNNDTQTLPIYESTGNKLALYIWLQPRSKATHRFKAKFSSDEPALCGGNLGGATGELRSPNLQSPYVCEWHYSQILNNSFTYNTILMNIKINSSRNTICHYFDSKLNIKSELDEGGLTFVRSVCGNNTEVSYRIPASTINIKATQNKNKPMNFDLHWKLQPCGGLIHVSQDDTNILNIPETYSSTIDCAWILVAPAGVKVEYKLEGNFNLDCSGEFLQISQGLIQSSVFIGDYCKTKMPEHVLVSSFMYTYIQYHSEPQNKTNIKLMIKTVSDQCGGYLTNYERMFTSPNYPGNYRENQECSWEIHADLGYRISLHFIERFVVEDRLNCTKDVIIIYDWRENKYEELAKLCGRNPPPVYNSTSNQMKVVFRTDATINLDGFKAKWVPICGGKFVAKEKEQYIYSPGYSYEYSPSLDCHYEIVSESERVMVKFLDLELEGTYPECKFDNVSITAQSDYNFYYGLFCGKKLPPPLQAYDNVKIEFKSDSYGQRKGFKLSYSLYSCGGQIKYPSVITSGLSDTYAENSNCTWLIEAPINNIIILKFLFIDIESSYECYNDYIAVYDSPYIVPEKRLSLICGHINSTTILRSTHNQMTLNFLSDSNLNYAGFRAEVLFTYSESVGCGGEIDLRTIRTRNLISPYINNSVVYENYLECLWTIKAPADHVIKIEFTAFHIAPCPNINQTALGFSKCDCDFVELKDGVNPNSIIIGTYCGHSLPPIISSSSNLMNLRLSTDGEDSSSGFTAILTTQPSTCGQSTFVVTHTTQYIKSPGYEDGFIPRGLHCRYFFDGRTESYSIIHIRIHDLDLQDGNENNCDKDKLLITGYSNPQNVSIGKDLIINEANDDFLQNAYFYLESIKLPKRMILCGAKKSVDYYVSSSVLINLLTSAEAPRPFKGVSIEVSYLGFCGRNYTELQGRIQTTSFSSISIVNEDCFTLITVPENYTISAYFLSVSPIYWNNKVYLEMFDGNTTKAKSLKKISGESVINLQVFSSGRYLLLHNHILGLDAVTFDLNYIASNMGPGCGGKLQNEIGRVTSPFYPEVYRRKNTCEWEIETPIGTKLFLHFAVFDLGRVCDQNYLRLVDKQGNTISTFCSESPSDYTSDDNYVKLVFITSLNNGGTGWVVDFQGIL